jgi:hypothetical protein
MQEEKTHITREELKAAGVSVKSLETWVTRGTVVAFRRGVYEISSLPADARRQVALWLAGTKQDRKRSALPALLELSAVERWAIETGLPAHDARKLMRLEAWMRMLSQMPAKPAGFETKKEMWSEAMEVINAEIAEGRCYGRGFTNPKSLEIKVAVWKREGNESLVDGNVCNQNGSKDWDWAKPKALLMYLNLDESWEHHIKALGSRIYPMFIEWYNEQVAAMELAILQGKKYAAYQRISYVDKSTGELVEIGELGKPPVSFKTFENYLLSDELREQVAYYRHGKKYFSDRFGRYVKGKRPELVGSLWSADDYDMNFWVRDTQGRFSYRRVTVYIVWCATTGIPLGFSWTLRTKEAKDLTVHTVWEALYDAICFTGGRVAYEIELDGWNKHSEEYVQTMQILFKEVTFRKAAQGKYAESFNQIMQVEYLHSKAGYLGGNIQDTKQNSKRTEDFGNFAPKNYPIYTPADMAAMLMEYRAIKLGIEDAAEQVSTHAHNWASLVQGQFAAKYSSSYHGSFELVESRKLAGTPLAHHTTVGVRNRFAQFTRNSETFTYDVPAHISNASVTLATFHKSITGLENPFESPLKGAHAFAGDAYIGFLPATTEVSRAKAERTSEDVAALSAAEAQRAAQLKAVQEAMANTVNSVKNNKDIKPKKKAKKEAPELDLSLLDLTATYEAGKATGQDEKALKKAAEEDEIANLLSGSRWAI